MYKVFKGGGVVVKSSRFHEAFVYFQSTFIPSSSFQETYLKEVVHLWLLKEQIHYNPLVLKKHILKELYIIGYWREYIHPIL